MGRVLGIGAGLMGVLLVVMTAGLWFRRATTEPEYGMLFHQSNDDDSTTVVLRVPELNYVRQVTPTFDAKWTFSWTEENRLILFVAREVGNSISSLYKFNLDTLKLEIVASGQIGGYEMGILLAPNQQWLMSYESCQIFDVQSGETRNLRDLFPGFKAVLCEGFSPDSQWIWVVALRDGERNEAKHSYRIRLSDGFIDYVGERIGNAQVLYRSLETEWAIGEIITNRTRRYYRTDPDNIQWQPVINASPAVLSTDRYQEMFGDWLPEYRLLIIHVTYDGANEQEVAVPFEGGPPAWIARNVRYLRYLDHPDWLFFQGHQGKIYRMHPDGTGFALIVSLPSSSVSRWEYVIEDQDGTEWLYLDSYPDQRDTGSYIIWRVQLDGTDFEAVLKSDDMLYVGDWSPDHKWLLLETGVDDAWDIYHKARLDGTDKQFVLADPHSYFFDWSLSPTKPSQPVLLLIIGSGLMGISMFGKRPYRHIRQRRRPAA